MSRFASQLVHIVLGRPSPHSILIEAHPIILNDKSVLFKDASGSNIGFNVFFVDRHNLQRFCVSGTSSRHSEKKKKLITLPTKLLL